MGGLSRYGPEEKGIFNNDTNLEGFESICIGTQVTPILLVAITTCFVKMSSVGDRMTLPRLSVHCTRIEVLVM